MRVIFIVLLFFINSPNSYAYCDGNGEYCQPLSECKAKSIAYFIEPTNFEWSICQKDRSSIYIENTPFFIINDNAKKKFALVSTVKAKSGGQYFYCLVDEASEFGGEINQVWSKLKLQNYGTKIAANQLPASLNMLKHFSSLDQIKVSQLSSPCSFIYDPSKNSLSMFSSSLRVGKKSIFIYSTNGTSVVEVVSTQTFNPLQLKKHIDACSQRFISASSRSEVIASNSASLWKTSSSMNICFLVEGKAMFCPIIELSEAKKLVKKIIKDDAAIDIFGRNPVINDEDQYWNLLNSSMKGGDRIAPSVLLFCEGVGLYE